MAQTPISVPRPNTRLTQLTRLASASLGTSMPAALATAVRSRGSRPLSRWRALGRCDWVERGALKVHQGTTGRVGVEHPGGRRGRALGTHPHGDRGQHGRQVAIEAGSGSG